MSKLKNKVDYTSSDSILFAIFYLATMVSKGLNSVEVLSIVASPNVIPSIKHWVNLSY